MSIDIPNTWMYAKDFHKCSCCGMLRADKHLTIVKDTEMFLCTNRDECVYFKENGHGRDPWPHKDQRAQEEFNLLP